jgi:ABC-type transporter Mla MlaB component
MLTYTVEKKPCLTPFVQKTLYVEGKADSKEWQKLKVIFFDALNSSDHLIVNISNVEEFDYPFSALICSIRRTAQFLGKRLTIVGNATDFFACVHECALLDRKKGCAFKIDTPCYLWESSAGEIPEVPGAWVKRLASRRPNRKL